MKEIWKDVVGYEGIYQISNFGNVKSYAKIRKGYSYKAKRSTERYYKPKDIIPGLMRGYLGVRLTKNGVCKTKLVHRLVAEAFIINHKNKPFVNHIDFDTENNRVDNLEWCTQYENVHHTMNHGRDSSPKGEDQYHSKLKVEDVIDIRELYSKGILQGKIALKYNVDTSNISCIVNYKTWKHI